MTHLTDLSFKVHPVLLMRLVREGQSRVGVVKVMDRGNEGPCGKWRATCRYVSLCMG